MGEGLDVVWMGHYLGTGGGSKVCQGSGMGCVVMDPRDGD